MKAIKFDMIEYDEAYELQLKVQRLVIEEKLENIVFFLEHPSVITLGSNENEGNILIREEILNSYGIKTIKSNRGGDVTYHGPGQIVGYPIFNLKYLGKDVREYVKKLEEAIIRFLHKEHNILSGRYTGFPGVWIEDDKIAAIGCSLKRWVTIHGFAININTNLEHFKFITPCGIQDKGVTSLKRLTGIEHDINKNIELIAKYLAEVFELDYEFELKEYFLKRIEEL